MTDVEEAPPVESEPVEPRAERLRRHRRRAGLYTWTFVLVALVVVLIALAVANTRQVRVSWVVGKSNASLVWIVLATAVLGWLLGLATSVVFRLRTRRRHTKPTTHAPHAKGWRRWQRESNA